MVCNIRILQNTSCSSHVRRGSIRLYVLMPTVQQKQYPRRFHSSFYMYQVIRQLLIRLPRLLQSSVAVGFLHQIVTNAEYVSQIFQTKLSV